MRIRLVAIVIVDSILILVTTTAHRDPCRIGPETITTTILVALALALVLVLIRVLITTIPIVMIMIDDRAAIRTHRGPC